MAKSSRNAAQEIKKMTQIIVSQFKPEKIILFGSHAWGEPNEDSDIDLFVVKKTKNRRFTRMAINDALPRPMPIDLLVYTPKQVEKRDKMGDFFVQMIIKNGRILYEK